MSRCMRALPSFLKACACRWISRPCQMRLRVSTISLLSRARLNRFLFMSKFRYTRPSVCPCHSCCGKSGHLFHPVYTRTSALMSPLSSISFVLGAIFAYKIIFPPAAKYLLGLGQDFRLLLKADDYFDFIIIVMLGMGIVFQMPAITYVLARIGLVTAKFLIKIWKTALIVILISAAVLSPTNDIPNMLLFAAPMIALYIVSIFVAWIFSCPRTAV